MFIIMSVFVKAYHGCFISLLLLQVHKRKGATMCGRNAGGRNHVGKLKRITYCQVQYEVVAPPCRIKRFNRNQPALSFTRIARISKGEGQVKP